MSIIDKDCLCGRAFLRRFGYYPRARDAFFSVLAMRGIGAGDTVLLPAYIGYSPREGSGVFDPITARAITPVFYRVDKGLDIDEEDAMRCIRGTDAKALLLIHYFGMPDPAFLRLAAAARARGMLVIEDAAHALYSDMVGGVCGRVGDYSLYSLHKMLPFAGGGMLAANGDNVMPPDAADACAFGDPFSYDFFQIASARRANYAALHAALLPLAGELTPLWPSLPAGVVPQTFPAIVERLDRFALYRHLNAAGYGAVGLYHTMVEPLRDPKWEASAFLAARIINFPVHQDVRKADYEGMIGAIRTFIVAAH